MTTYRIAVGFTKLYLVNVAAPSEAVALEWIALDWQANGGKHWEHVRIADAVPVFTVEGWHGCPDGHLADIASAEAKSNKATRSTVTSEGTCKDDVVPTLNRRAVSAPDRRRNQRKTRP